MVLPTLVKSSAFPPGTDAISTRKRTDTTFSSISFSEKLEAEDMETVRELHSEWFPLSYDDDFYNSVEAGTVEYIGARNSRNELVALAIYRVRALRELPGAEDFLGQRFDGEESAGYLMTLGVADEWRGRGVGRELLDKVVRKLENSVSLLYLHVVDYNAAGKALYKKAGFKEISRKSEFYYIQNRYFSAITLAHCEKFPDSPSCFSFI